MVVRFNTSIPMLKLYIYSLGIRRCDGPGRHRMLTVINASYGYYEIWLICWILHQFVYIALIQDIKFKVQHFQTGNPLIQML